MGGTFDTCENYDKSWWIYFIVRQEINRTRRKSFSVIIFLDFSTCRNLLLFILSPSHTHTLHFLLQGKKRRRLSIRYNWKKLTFCALCNDFQFNLYLPWLRDRVGEKNLRSSMFQPLEYFLTSHILKPRAVVINSDWIFLTIFHRKHQHDKQKSTRSVQNAISKMEKKKIY